MSSSDISWFIAAIATLFVGHIAKAARWSLFITPFQAVRKAHLFRSLALGYALNAVLPFRLGELARAVSLNRMSGLPFSHALSTIVLDRMFDLIVAIILASLLITGGWINASLIWPLMIGILTVTLLVLAATNNWLLKRTCYAVAAPFNKRIRLWLLMSCWSFFTAVRMLGRRRTAMLFAGYSAAMWFSYLSAFFMISAAVIGDGSNGYVKRLADHYLVGNLYRSSISMSYGSNEILFIAFLVTPLLLMLLYSLIQARMYRSIPIIHDAITKTFVGMFSSPEQIRLLPYLDSEDQLLYLESFFTSIDSRPALTILEQNRDIAVVRNVSGGSNATTMLAIRQGKLLYRKYATGSEAVRLGIQHTWLLDNARHLPLTTIINAKSSPGYFSYDMPHSVETCDLFTYIHCHDVERSWTLLSSILDTMTERLHRPTRRPSDTVIISDYLKKKYIDNIRMVMSAPRCSALSGQDTLLINNQRYRNLGWFENHFDSVAMSKRLSGDWVCTVHGDLTAENIIIDPRSTDGYYLIDPNPKNIFDSEMIDFAKIRQSLNYGYEFLMRESACRVNGDTVEFRHTISQAYQELCGRLDDHLLRRFGPSGLHSVCFHELVNYARMMPYKLRHGEISANLFYAALVVLHNRFHDRFATAA